MKKKGPKMLRGTQKESNTNTDCTHEANFKGSGASGGQSKLDHQTLCLNTTLTLQNKSIVYICTSGHTRSATDLFKEICSCT